MRSKNRNILAVLAMALALSGLTAASALAAGAPIVETKAATAISGAGATLNGVVNANGATTKYYFEYGPTTSYGSKTRERAALGSNNVEAEEKITALNPKTTYHFRLAATNSSGTSYGKDQQFTTLVEPEVVVSPGEKITEVKLTASSGSMALEWANQQSITCSYSEFSGQFINSKELEGKMRWSECFEGDRYECFNEKGSEKGSAQSWIQSEELKGKLGYINRAKKEVGLVLAGKSSEVWAKNVNCLDGTYPLTGSLGGQLSLPVNTKIAAGGSFPMAYREEKDNQVTGELGGQLLWENGAKLFGIDDNLTAKANKAFEIQA